MGSLAVTMTGTLALVGGSEFTEGCTFDVDLLADSGGDEVLVLLTAAAFENPAKVAARASERFGAIGARVVPLMVLRRPDALVPDVDGQFRPAVADDVGPMLQAHCHPSHAHGTAAVSGLSRLGS